MEIIHTPINPNQAPAPVPFAPTTPFSPLEPPPPSSPQPQRGKSAAGDDV